jgi:hypothetical protein
MAATAQALSLTAMEEASRRGQREADIDDLFLALVVSEQIAGQVLRWTGITLDAALEAVAAQHAAQLESIGITADLPDPGTAHSRFRSVVGLHGAVHTRPGPGGVGDARRPRPHARVEPGIDSVDPGEAGRFGATWVAHAPTHRPDGKPLDLRPEFRRQQVELLDADEDSLIAWRFTYPDATRANPRCVTITMEPAAAGTHLGITLEWTPTPKSRVLDRSQLPRAIPRSPPRFTRRHRFGVGPARSGSGRTLADPAYDFHLAGRAGKQSKRRATWTTFRRYSSDWRSWR